MQKNNMQLSDMVVTIQPSLTRKLFNMAKEYENVIDFTLGDPDFLPPKSVREAAMEAIQLGKTRYSHNAGLLSLRELISKDIYKETACHYNPASEIMVSVGAMEALYITLISLINEGDEVIIPAPYWINYVHMVQMCKGIPVIVDSYEKDNFLLSLENIENAITPKTKVIIINNPNNPTGMVMSPDILSDLCNIIKKHDLIIIWDEVYKSIIYDDIKYKSILEYSNMQENTVLINSFSKKYAMTGWRIGYVAAPEWLISNMIKLQENIVACAPLPSQYAAIAALEGKGDKEVREMIKVLSERRAILFDLINDIKGLKTIPLQSTFYGLVNIKCTGLGSEEFAYALLKTEQVAVVPGITYGNCCEGYIRIAYTLPVEKIKDGMSRIKRFVE